MKKWMIAPLVFSLAVMPVQASKGYLKVDADKTVYYQSKDFDSISESLDEIEALNPVLQQAYRGHSDVNSAGFSVFRKTPDTNMNIEVRQENGTVLAKLAAKDFKDIFSFVEYDMKKEVSELVASAESDRYYAWRMITILNGTNPYSESRSFDLLKMDLLTAGLIGSIGENNGTYYQIMSIDAVQEVKEGDDVVGWRYVVTSETAKNRDVIKVPRKGTYTYVGSVKDSQAQIDEAIDIESFGNILIDVNGSNLVYDWKGRMVNGRLIYGTSEVTTDKSKWVPGSEIYFRAEDLNNIKNRIKEEYRTIDDVQQRRIDCFKEFVSILNTKGVEITKSKSFEDLYDACLDFNGIGYILRVPESTEYYEISYEYNGDLLTALIIKPL